MDKSCVIVDAEKAFSMPISKEEEGQIPLSDEEKELKFVRDYVIKLSRRESIETLMQKYRHLQNAYRLQNVSKRFKAETFIEIRKVRYIIEILKQELL